jgi:DNA polymerase III delta prime subunit
MGRPERPLNSTDDPIAAFARDLRELRLRAGNPSYRQLARTAMFAPSVLSSAASGHRLPTLPVTLAFVSSCGGDPVAWERRWRRVAALARAVTDARGERAAAVSPRPGVQPPAEPAPGPQAPRPIANVATALACPAQLPIGPSTFVGRKQALASASRVMGPARRVKTPLLITGPIGVGKTAFALQLADELAPEFPDGQLYADLSPRGVGAPSADGIMRGFLRALGVPAHRVPEDQMQRTGLYRSLLAQRRLFVLLEGAYDESQVRPLLGQSAHTQVVVTSSARLLGLDGMHRIELDTLTRQESLTLIGRLIGTERTQAESAAADAIAERCGDLPLAVNIMARKIAARPGWTVGYAAGLLCEDRLLDCLSVGDVNVRDRLASAYRLLPSACQRAVQKLGVAGAKWPTAAGLAEDMGISGDSAEELLESVVDVGLLTRADSGGRYGMSMVVSAFAASTKRDLTYLTVPLPGVLMRERVFARSAGAVHV